MIQNQLKLYGPMRLLATGENMKDNYHIDLENSSGQPDIQRIKNLEDAKQKITVYQLWKSQFVFYYC